MKKKNGDIIWVQISSRVLHDKNDKPYYEGIVRDITEQKSTLNKIEYLSFHDKLTGLYNRTYFDEELKRVDTKRRHPVSIVFGDMNGLKKVNDRYGHLEGDHLLREMARILKLCFRSEDIVARWGGDEFIIILPRTSIEIANKIIGRIKKRSRQLRSRKHTLSIAPGASTRSDSKQDFESVIKEAENRMYLDKEKSRHIIR